MVQVLDRVLQHRSSCYPLICIEQASIFPKNGLSTGSCQLIVMFSLSEVTVGGAMVKGQPRSIYPQTVETIESKVRLFNI